jgi:SlyX protein
MTDSERIAELEVRVAFQDNVIQELSDVIARQQQQLDVLQGAHQKLYARLEEVSQGVEEAPGIEVPPHY